METDYKDYFNQSVSKEGDITTVPAVRRILQTKLNDEINYLIAHSAQPLTNFLFYMKTKYMIENTVSIIEGLGNQQPMSQLMGNIDPLGDYKEIAQIQVAVEQEDRDFFAKVYKHVLIDTPVGPYFLRFLEQEIDPTDFKSNGVKEVQRRFKENPEFMRIQLEKMWLEDFAEFCKECNPSTQEVMADLLNYDADMMTLGLVYNSFPNREFSTQVKRVDLMKKLLPKMGYLYPAYYYGSNDQSGNMNRGGKLLSCSSLEELKTEALFGATEYQTLLKEVYDP